MEKGKPHEYVEILDIQKKQNRNDYLNFQSTKNTGIPFSVESMRGKSDLLLRATLKSDDLHAYCDALNKVKTSCSLGRFSYEPALVIGTQKVTRKEKNQLNFIGLVLDKIQGRLPASGSIISMGGKRHRVKLENHYKAIIPAIQTLRDWINHPHRELPPAILNKNCPFCPFKVDCEKEAREKDHLSLLRGISQTEIEKHNERGIFTVTQLSYTYRPRRQRESKSKIATKFYYSLKALAIRDKKVYIVQKPQLEQLETAIFLDVEGDPDRDLYYLIGVIVHHKKVITKYSFWANTEEDEVEIWNQFIKLIDRYKGFKIFHYGNYEIIFIKRMMKKYGIENQDCIDYILQNSINVLSLIYSNIYFPIYSNSIKDIATYLGYSWTDKDASGIKSLVWRKKWELENHEYVKQKLISYNQDDCMALHVIHKYISEILKGRDQQGGRLDFSLVEEIPGNPSYKFGKIEFVLDEFEHINQCAYFDYQKEKITLRHRKKPNHKLVKKRRLSPVSGRINKIIELPLAENCPRCQSLNLYKHGIANRLVYDLRISDSGVKRWITKYISKRFQCRTCGYSFTPKEFSELMKFGWCLFIWVVFQIVALRQTYTVITTNLRSSFELDFETQICTRAKSYVSQYYHETYRQILRNLIQGDLVQADETTCKIKKSKHYIWVISSFSNVFFFYSPTSGLIFII